MTPRARDIPAVTPRNWTECRANRLNERNSQVVASYQSCNRFFGTIELWPQRCLVTAECPLFAGDPDPHQAVRLSHRQCHREHAVEVSAAQIERHEIFKRAMARLRAARRRLLCLPGRISQTIILQIGLFVSRLLPEKKSRLHPPWPEENFFSVCLFVFNDLKWWFRLMSHWLKSTTVHHLTSPCLASTRGALYSVFHCHGHWGQSARTCSRVLSDALKPPLGSQRETCARSEWEQRGRPQSEGNMANMMVNKFPHESEVHATSFPKADGMLCVTRSDPAFDPHEKAPRTNCGRFNFL